MSIRAVMMLTYSTHGACQYVTAYCMSKLAACAFCHFQSIPTRSMHGVMYTLVDSIKVDALPISDIDIVFKSSTQSSKAIDQ